MAQRQGRENGARAWRGTLSAGSLPLRKHLSLPAWVQSCQAYWQGPQRPGEKTSFLRGVMPWALVKEALAKVTVSTDRSSLRAHALAPTCSAFPASSDLSPRLVHPQLLSALMPKDYILWTMGLFTNVSDPGGRHSPSLPFLWKTVLGPSHPGSGQGSQIVVFSPLVLSSYL